MKHPITKIYLMLCLLVTIPAGFNVHLFELLSAELPHEQWWQLLTPPFLHGASGQPLAIMGHLLLNMLLLLTCGKQVEELLGSKRFLLLSLTAWAGFTLTQFISGIWINGSSGIIWAYSPFLLIWIKKAKSNPDYQALADRSKGLLTIMWVIVTIAMGFVPLLFNPSHSLIHTFIYGNLFHFSATVVGFIFYGIWRNNLLTDYSE